MDLSKILIKIKSNYKKEHSDEWTKILGGGTFKIVEDQEDVTTCTDLRPTDIYKQKHETQRVI